LLITRLLKIAVVPDLFEPYPLPEIKYLQNKCNF